MKSNPALLSRMGTSATEVPSRYAQFGMPATYLHKVLCIENGEFVSINQLVQSLLRVLEIMVLPDGKSILDRSRKRSIIVRALKDGRLVVMSGLLFRVRTCM